MTVQTRRGFFKSVSATAATAALPATALAYQGPVTETPEPKLPDWWERLVSADGTDETHPHAWQDTPLNRQIAHHIEAIHQAILDEAPEGTKSVSGIQWKWINGVPVGVWATCRTSRYSLWQFRPEFGWKEHGAEVMGGSV